MQDLLVRSKQLSPAPVRTTLTSGLPLAVGICLALLLQWLSGRDILSPFYANVLTVVGIYVILAVSLNIVNGFTGQLSLGHAGLMAVGGYAAAVTSYYSSLLLWETSQTHGMSGQLMFLASLLLGGVVAALVGFVIGLPSLRLRGDYLAIVTLGFGEIVRVLFQQTRPVIHSFQLETVRDTPLTELWLHMGGAVGMNAQPRYTNLFWVFTWVTITLVASYRLKYSSHGRAFLSIRENEIAAEAMGVPVTRYKVMAFVIASFFGGIAGGLYAHTIPLVPHELAFQKSIELAVMVVLGGMGSISGAVLAATVLVILPEAVREMGGDFKRYQMLAYALTLIIIMIARPKGLFGVREVWELSPVRKLWLKITGGPKS